VHRQRQLYTEHTIPEYRKQLLEELGFVWTIDIADAEASLNQREWEGKLEKLKEFKVKHGHCDVPRTFEKWGLGPWVSRQRTLKQNGRLDIRREEKLAAVGITWASDFDERWDERFSKLRAFKQKHGHCNPPKDLSLDLWQWVEYNRHRQKIGKMPPERKAKLDGMGFPWGNILYDRWNEFFGKLKAFKQTHGHCSPPMKVRELYNWGEYQRQRQRQGKLPAQRKEKLDDIGFIWENDHDDRWDEHFRKLEAFKWKYGHCNAPWKLEIYSWIRQQQNRHRKGTLPRERKIKLMQLVWIGNVLVDVKRERWTRSLTWKIAKTRALVALEKRSARPESHETKRRHKRSVSVVE
jgi:hypothetical protein